MYSHSIQMLQSVRHIFIPAERKIPKIRIETRQADRLISQRIIVAIDSWPKHSRYPVVSIALLFFFFVVSLQLPSLGIPISIIFFWIWLQLPILFFFLHGIFRSIFHKCLGFPLPLMECIPISFFVHLFCSILFRWK